VGKQGRDWLFAKIERKKPVTCGLRFRMAPELKDSGKGYKRECGRRDYALHNDNRTQPGGTDGK